MFRFSQQDSIEHIKTQILNQAKNNVRPRVIAIDNIKTRRFSSADLESLITSKDVSGKVLYCGNGVVPNLNTFVFTINGASLSKDLAQRSAVIKLGKSVFTQTWSDEVDEFIKNNTWSMIGEIGELLQSTGNPLQNEVIIRFGPWVYGVLSKVEDPLDVLNMIKKRQSQIDDDASNSDEFLQHILEDLNITRNSAPQDVEKIQHNKMHELLVSFYGKGYNVGKNIVKKTIEGMGLPCLKQVVAEGRSRYWLFRRDGQKLTPEQIEAGSQNQHGWLNTIDLTESDNQDDESYDGEGQNLTIEEIEAGSPNHVDWLTRYLTNSDNQDEEFYDWEGQDLTTEEIEAGSPNHHAWLNPIDLPDGDNQDDEFPD